jgi:hypothetical protein
MRQDLDSADPEPVEALGEARSAGDLCDVHGSALFSLAWMILGDRDDAEFVAVQAVLDACSGPVHVAHASDRWEMARYVYVRCVRHQQAAGRYSQNGSPDHGESDTTSKTLELLSANERAAIALGIFGEHTYEEIADLMHLRRPEVAVLLRSGLHALRHGQNSVPRRGGSSAGMS